MDEKYNLITERLLKKNLSEKNFDKFEEILRGYDNGLMKEPLKSDSLKKDDYYFRLVVLERKRFLKNKRSINKLEYEENLSYLLKLIIYDSKVVNELLLDCSKNILEISDKFSLWQSYLNSNDVMAIFDRLLMELETN